MAAAIVLPSFPVCHNSPNCSRRNEVISLHLLPACCALSPLSHAPSATTAARKLSRSSSSRPPNRSMQQRSESISLCTNSDEVDAVELSALLAATRQNCEQFPAVLNDGSIAPVDPVKLRRALRHSTVVVALYVEVPEISGADSNGKLPAEEKLDGRAPGRGWLDSWMLQPRGQKTLVAFGRATSDHELTASIYDLVTLFINCVPRTQMPRLHHLIKDPGLGVECYSELSENWGGGEFLTLQRLLHQSLGSIFQIYCL